MKRIFFDNRGVALIVVILMVSIIVAVTIELNRATRADVYETANLSDGIRLYYIAKSGFYGGEAMLVADNNNFDAFTENWAKMELISRQSEALFRQGAFSVRIEDDSGKIPINKLVNGNAYDPQIKDLLVRLLNLPEFELAPDRVDGIVDSIKDWIDKDDEQTGLGVESSYYKSLDRPHPAKNGLLDCIDELLMIKGVTKELYYGTKDTPALKDCLTIYGDGRININTAPKPVLRALFKDGLSEDAADKMDDYRRTEGNNLADVNWYKNLSGLGDVKLAYEMIAVKSNYFTIISTGYLGKMKEVVSGSIKRGQGTGTADILSWKVD